MMDVSVINELSWQKNRMWHAEVFERFVNDILFTLGVKGGIAGVEKRLDAIRPLQFLI